MSKPSSRDEHGSFDIRSKDNNALACEVPPVISATVPISRKTRRPSPLGIAVHCVACVAALLGAGGLALGFMVHSRSKARSFDSARAREVSEKRLVRAGAIEAG